jgi:sugar transferase (PEP-CTERM/EpsH1 system associated)
VDTLGTGGLENGLVNLIARLDPVRFVHTVVAMRGLGRNAERLPRDRVQVISLEKAPGARTQLPMLVKTISQVQPDIVHSRNWGAIEAVFAGRWTGGCTLVHSEHGLESNPDVREPLRRVWLRRLAYELANRVISVSYHLRDFHAQRTGFAKRKISVIHNGVDSRRFFCNPAARASVRAELRIADDEFCIGCVGNLLPIKDHMTLMRAVDAFDQSARQWRLLLIGDGSERRKLEAFAAAHAWNARVSFLGSSDRVPDLLNAMDVYVLPSIAEGISNSILEAMATGLPVVATATGGNPEVVVDGESGLLFAVGADKELTEHLCRLWGRRELREQFGTYAHERVRQEFSLNSMVQQYDRLYWSLCQRVRDPLPAAAGV